MTRHIPTYKCNEIQREISVQRIQSNHPTTQPLPRIILFHVQNTPTASRFTSRLPFPPNRWLPPPWNYKRARARAFYIRRAARNCLYPPAAWERAWQFFVTRAKKLQRALREIKKERKRISALTVIPNRRHSSSSSSPFSSRSLLSPVVPLSTALYGFWGVSDFHHGFVLAQRRLISGFKSLFSGGGATTPHCSATSRSKVAFPPRERLFVRLKINPPPLSFSLSCSRDPIFEVYDLAFRGCRLQGCRFSFF